MSQARLYVRFLALALTITAGLGLLGYAPTVRLGGPEAVRAMFAGCAASVLATLVGSIPLVRLRRDVIHSAVPAALLAMGLRFIVVLALGVAAALSGWFAPPPLLIWLAVSYLALLGADTWYAVRMIDVTKQEKE